MKRFILATIVATSINITATTTPSVAAVGRCPQFEQLLAAQAARTGWNVTKMSRTMFRESRCQTDAVNRRGGDSGLLQIHPVSWPWLSTKLGVTVTRSWLLNPTNNVTAAATLCVFWRNAGKSCYRPWRGGA